MRTVRTALGLVLIVAGLVAIPVPVLPGIPLFAAGVAMLGSDHALIRSGRSWLSKRGILKSETRSASN